MPKVEMGRKKTLPTFQKTGHWVPRCLAALAWEGEEGWGKPMRRAGTPMKDWVIALPGEGKGLVWGARFGREVRAVVVVVVLGHTEKDERHGNGGANDGLGGDKAGRGRHGS